MDALVKPDIAALLAVGPLPQGVKSLIRIVAEGEWRDSSTEHVYGRCSPEAIRTASAAFLAVVLFDHRSDAYRVLGLPAGAPLDEVRENKRLLLKWLHPDRNPRPQEQEYLARVLKAAEEIETRRGSPGRPPPIRGGAAAPGPRAMQGRRSATLARARAREHRTQQAARSAWARALTSLLRTVKYSALMTAMVLTGLLTWRYVMEEPIGVSVERYAQAAMGLITW